MRYVPSRAMEDWEMQGYVGLWNSKNTDTHNLSHHSRMWTEDFTLIICWGPTSGHGPPQQFTMMQLHMLMLLFVLFLSLSISISCVMDDIITCTVTGPTVIDFHGHVNTVEDRCAYSLLSTPKVPDFLLLANFRERRREDVSFLDSVTLTGTDFQIHMEQGGVVRVSYLLFSHLYLWRQLVGVFQMFE